LQVLPCYEKIPFSKFTCTLSTEGFTELSDYTYFHFFRRPTLYADTKYATCTQSTELTHNGMAAWRSGGIPTLPFKSAPPAAVAPNRSLHAGILFVCSTPSARSVPNENFGKVSMTKVRKD